MYVIQQFARYDETGCPRYFATKEQAESFRDSNIGRDEGIDLCYGLWELTRIGPDADADADADADGELNQWTLETWKYIGRWDISGHNHTITGIERKAQ